jgi:predicted flap endonuclease-1-like 5' DNA nuclease
LKFLLWFGLAALLGGTIGWLLRSLTTRAQLAHARSASVDDDELERMRHRLADLEQVVAERDRLRMQVADFRAADSPGVVGAGIPDAVDAEDDDVDGSDAPIGVSETAEEAITMPDGSTEVAVAPGEAVEQRSDHRDDLDDPGAEASDADATDAGDPAGDVATAPDGSTDVAGLDAILERDDMPSLDLEAAADVLGKKITLDDLTVVEGIGPKISELCRGIGIDTWRNLADTDLDDLRSMLDAAGPRYQIHQPDSWPRQAELLATGQWDRFVELAGDLEGGS